MKVLSIDLDYIMAPSIQIYEGFAYDCNSTTRWNQLFDISDFTESHLVIDQGNLLYCFDTFLQALNHCDSISFGYDHDAILFDIEDKSNIDLINIDHHDDIIEAHFNRPNISFDEALERNYEQICNANRVNEGTWGAWLAIQGKLNSYTWIGNHNSQCKNKNAFNSRIVPNYRNVERDNYKFDDYKFDQIFVCLSPQYIPKNHWHYFSMFMKACEHSGKKAAFHNKKFEIKFRYSEVEKVLGENKNGL